MHGKVPPSHDQRSRPRKRTVRSRIAPIQAHDRKNRPADRASGARVLRKTHLRAQAQESCGGQAPLQAPAQPAVAAEALLTPAIGFAQQQGSVGWTKTMALRRFSSSK